MSNELNFSGLWAVGELATTLYGDFSEYLPKRVVARLKKGDVFVVIEQLYVPTMANGRWALVATPTGVGYVFIDPSVDTKLAE